MEKKLCSLIIFIILLSSISLSTFAANRVNTMDIQTVLYEDETTDVWGFGYDGILSLSRQEVGSFKEVSSFEIILSILFSLGLPIGLFIWIHRLKKKGSEKKWQQFADLFGYFREPPNQGNLCATYALGRLFEVCDDGAILAAGILRLIQLGCLSLAETQEFGFMGKTKNTVSLELMDGQHYKMNKYDEHLYTVLESAAGPDSILHTKELERFASKNNKLLRSYIQKCDSRGRIYSNQKHCLKRWNIPAKISDLTSTGEQELGELIGFKQYLTDFSQITERDIKEVSIWKELLNYAMLFGIAEQVTEQIKEIYPQISDQLTDYSQSMMTAYSYYYLLYSNMKKVEDQREQDKGSLQME